MRSASLLVRQALGSRGASRAASQVKGWWGAFGQAIQPASATCTHVRCNSGNDVVRGVSTFSGLWDSVNSDITTSGPGDSTDGAGEGAGDGAFVREAGAVACRRVSTRQPWHNPALDIWVTADPVRRGRKEGEPATPMDSLIGVRLPFGSNPSLRDQYVNHHGQIRMGKLLQDMDALAGHISYGHCGKGEEDVASGDLSIVTASCDRIDLLAPLAPDVDMIMLGCCTYVGKSSMNVDIELAEEHAPADRARTAFLTASFTFVARDGNNKAMEVPRLETPDERTQAWYEDGERRQKARKEFRASSLSHTPPTHAELELVYDLFMASGTGDAAHLRQPLREGQVHGHKTTMTTMMLCHPQNRNIHGKVFGGFLMLHAYELAWITAHAFTGQTPRFVALDDIQFLQPVSVGSIVHLSSVVEYAQGFPHCTLSVAVSAAVVDPAAKSMRVSNDFHFTFHVDGHVDAIVPGTFASAMRYIEAMRRQARGLALARERQTSSGGVHLKFFSSDGQNDYGA